MSHRNKKNGFQIFTNEWKSQHDLSYSKAVREASKEWNNMTEEKRRSYNERAKNENLNLNNRIEKLTCIGIPISQVEREREIKEEQETKMREYIETIVHKSMENGELESQSYYFVMINHFVKLPTGYVPAEIAIAEFSLEKGVFRKLHYCINPGNDALKNNDYMASIHSKGTHDLPLPPRAIGEKSMGKIYSKALEFIKNKKTGNYPPVYTKDCYISCVESVLQFLRKGLGEESPNLQVYRIEYLFYRLKVATCTKSGNKIPASYHFTNMLFEKDTFQYETGIACPHHETADKIQHCAKSYVVRWGFMFADYMCGDIDIVQKPGYHKPQQIEFKDHELVPSTASGSSNASDWIAVGNTKRSIKQKQFGVNSYGKSSTSGRK